jgi:hypothetical protein
VSIRDVQARSELRHPHGPDRLDFAAAGEYAGSAPESTLQELAQRPTIADFAQSLR